METASKAQKTPKPTDRIVEALATLGALLDRTINEVKVLDEDFQRRVVDALEKKEESLRTEVAEYIERVRRDVHDEVTRRSQAELQSTLDTLQADFRAERERWRPATRP